MRKRKPAPRRGIAANAKARDNWKGKSKKGSPEISFEMKRSADELLERHQPKDPALKGLLKARPAEWLEQAGPIFREETIKSHIKGLGLAYALWVKAESDPAFQEALEGAVDRLRERPTKRTQLLHLVVETVIAYGDDTPEGKANARKLYNRDVQAIRYLAEQKVLPEEVEVRGAKKGEGLDVWARGGKPGSRDGSKGRGSKGGDQVSTDQGPANQGSTDQEAGNQKPHARVNLIEWRSGNDQVQMVSLPDTPQTALLIDTMFKILEKVAEHTASGMLSAVPGDAAGVIGSSKASALVRSTATLMEQLGLVGDQRGRGYIQGDLLPEFIQLASRFVGDVDEWLAEQPGPAGERRAHRQQLSALRAAMNGSDPKAPPKKAA